MRTADRIRTFLNVEVLDVPLEGDALQEGLLDSLATERLICFLEEDFAIAFEDDELVVENFSDLARLAALVDRKTGAA